MQQAQSYGESQAMWELKGLRRMVQEFIDLISTFEVHSLIVLVLALRGQQCLPRPNFYPGSK